MGSQPTRRWMVDTGPMIERTRLMAILALPAGVVGYLATAAVIGSLPLPSGLMGLLLAIGPLFVAGVCMAVLLVPDLRSDGQTRSRSPSGRTRRRGRARSDGRPPRRSMTTPGVGSMSPTLQRLLEHLLDAPGPDAALEDLPTWLAASPRFRDFAQANRDKIRKKLRGAIATDARLDVRAELRVAALVLADRRIELTFEAYGVGRRGPDFTATFRAGRPFNIEVTRRHATATAGLEAPILVKLRQLPPSVANILVVAMDPSDGAPDPTPVLRDLQDRADHHDDAFFVTRGLADAAAFYAGLRRLAAVVVWVEHAEPGRRLSTWVNAGARIPVPLPTLRALEAALRA